MGVDNPCALRVASVPHGHVYVRHLNHPSAPPDVTRLPDPVTHNSPVGASWWPHGMLNADWIRTHADEFDVFHVHFGFDAVDPVELRRIAGALRDAGKPLVYTVHDLHNPHQVDRRAHDAALNVLVPAADALITLTPGAAAEIADRWRRRAEVIAHPHVVDADHLHQPRPERERPLVGIHLKSLRANMNPLPVLDVLLTEVPARGADLLINVHNDVMTPGNRNHDPAVSDLLRSAATYRHVRVQIHDYYSDADLWEYLGSLDLSVLPYRFGTHSGWLEACYDLGTRVLAPYVGYYHEQHEGVLGYRLDADGTPNVTDIGAAIDAVCQPYTWRATREERFTQRAQIAAAHRRVYETALGRLPA